MNLYDSKKSFVVNDSGRTIEYFFCEKTFFVLNRLKSNNLFFCSLFIEQEESTRFPGLHFCWNIQCFRFLASDKNTGAIISEHFERLLFSHWIFIKIIKRCRLICRCSNEIHRGKEQKYWIFSMNIFWKNSNEKKT